MTNKFTLDEHGEPTPCADLREWAMFYQSSLRVVRVTELSDSRISTVFLGLDHSFGVGGEPILWETMVFGGPMDEEQDRCAGKRADAVAMHERMVQRVKEALTPKPT